MTVQAHELIDSTVDPVRAKGPESATWAVDEGIATSVYRHARLGRAALDRRIADLEAEWDITRALVSIAATSSLVGLAFGARRRALSTVLPAVGMVDLALLAFTGWCPGVAALRRLGFRTRREIEAEKWALKALRGDLDQFFLTMAGTPEEEAGAALAAIRGYSAATTAR